MRPESTGRKLAGVGEHRIGDLAEVLDNLGVFRAHPADVADRVGPIWGIGTDGELRNMYARTAQEGFFIAGGGFPAARVYSQYTAVLIKADLEGLLRPCAT